MRQKTLTTDQAVDFSKMNNWFSRFQKLVKFPFIVWILEWIKGGVSQKKLFLQFCTDSSQIWILYVKFDKKSIEVKIFLIRPLFFKIFAFLVGKNWIFFYFSPFFILDLLPQFLTYKFFFGVILLLKTFSNFTSIFFQISI